MKILFVRHGKDDDRYRGGWSKLDLTEEGVEEVMELAKHLKKNKKEYNIDRIVSSDLQRALTTSEIIAKELELHITKEEAIRETNNGDLAGMLNEEALVKYPGMFFSSLDMDEAYPNGESPREFYVRIREWFENFVEEHKNDKENIIVVMGAQSELVENTFVVKIKVADIANTDNIMAFKNLFNMPFLSVFDS